MFNHYVKVFPPKPLTRDRSLVVKRSNYVVYVLVTWVLCTAVCGKLYAVETISKRNRVEPTGVNNCYSFSHCTICLNHTGIFKYHIGYKIKYWWISRPRFVGLPFNSLGFEYYSLRYWCFLGAN